MNTIKKSLAVVLAFALSTAAEAGGSLKDGGEPAPHAFNWTGIYVGAHGGLATGTTNGRADLLGLASISAEYDVSGAVYGAHVGYNQQFGSLVLGIEGSYSAADINGSQTCLLLLNCARKVDGIASLVGRIGYAADRTMVYSSMGLAWADVETNVTDNILGGGLLSAKANETHLGWVVGLGVEHAVARNITARIEYNHYEFGSETHNLDVNFLGAPAGVTIPTKVGLDVDTIRIGATIKIH